MTSAFRACGIKFCISHEVLYLPDLAAAEPHQGSQAGSNQPLLAGPCHPQALQPSGIQAHSRMFHSWGTGSLEDVEPTEGRCPPMLLAPHPTSLHPNHIFQKISAHCPRMILFSNISSFQFASLLLAVTFCSTNVTWNFFMWSISWLREHHNGNQELNY